MDEEIIEGTENQEATEKFDNEKLVSDVYQYQIGDTILLEQPIDVYNEMLPQRLWEKIFVIEVVYDNDVKISYTDSENNFTESFIVSKNNISLNEMRGDTNG